MILDQLNKDLKEAMIARDSLRKETIQGLKSAIGYAKVDKGEDLDDDEVTRILQKEAKKRAEAEELFRKGGNQESADKEKAEAEMINAYLPEMVGEEEIAKAVEDAIGSTGASTMQDMGKVIGLVKGKFGSSADGSLIAKVTKDKLS